MKRFTACVIESSSFAWLSGLAETVRFCGVVWSTWSKSSPRQRVLTLGNGRERLLSTPSQLLKVLVVAAPHETTTRKVVGQAGVLSERGAVA